MCVSVSPLPRFSRPDVLLMDEVLAVGDLNFQKKCFDHILNLKRQGAAIILVSHAPGAIWAVCNRGLFMDHGVARVEGPVENVVRAYENQNSRNASNSDQQFTIASGAHGRQDALVEAAAALSSGKSGTGDAIASNFELVTDRTRGTAIEIGFREPFAVEVDIEVLKPIDNALVRVVADAVHYRSIVTIDNYEQGAPIDRLEPGRHKFRISVPEQNFRPGAYIFNVAMISRHVGVHLFLWLKCSSFGGIEPIRSLLLFGSECRDAFRRQI